MILHSGIILYHGSYVTVEKPELEKCYPYKDFGRGFYLTTSQEQAVSFVRSSVAKAAGRGDVQPNTKWGFVSKYIFQTDICGKIFSRTCCDSNCHRKITETDQILTKCSLGRKDFFSCFYVISIMCQCFLFISRNFYSRFSHFFYPPGWYKLPAFPVSFLKQKLCQVRKSAAQSDTFPIRRYCVLPDLSAS